MGGSWHDNGNSFDTSMQFEAHGLEGPLDVRVKVYWKSLQLLQSETVTKNLGMNTKGLFYPSVRMNLALKESHQYTQSRIEITYSAKTLAGEVELLDDDFSLRNTIDLTNVQLVLDRVPGLCWPLSMKQLLDGFIEKTRT